MKINGNTIVKDIDENPIVLRQTEKSAVYATLFDMFRMCLITDHPEADRGETGEAKFKRWQLAKRIVADEFEISAEEAVLIKQRSALIHSTTVYGRICEAIEQ